MKHFVDIFFLNMKKSLWDIVHVEIIFVTEMY